MLSKIRSQQPYPNRHLRTDLPVWETLLAPSIWVAVKDLNSSYYIGETTLVTIYIHMHPLR